MCSSNIAYTIDMALLPMFFQEFQVMFGVSETSLAMLSTAKGIVAALFTLPCGFMAELLPRPRLIGLGMLFWAGGLTICATAVSYEALFAGRMLNGMGLGIVQPLLFSLTADKTLPTKRGSAFGALFFIGEWGAVLFGFVATATANKSLGGTAGWRVSVFVVVAFSACIGVLVMLFVEEPRAGTQAERPRAQGFVSVFAENMPKILRLFRYPSFALIAVQGMFGMGPWIVFPFFTQWLELACFTHGEAALLYAIFGCGCACSHMLSGQVLNFVSRRFPDHGPPSIANFSVASGFPFLVIIFFLFPKPAALGKGSALLPVYLLAFCLFGLGAKMCFSLNKKIFSDIVPSALFSYVFAMDQLVENVGGNIVGLAVGILADRAFHYEAADVKTGSCSPENAEKLGLGMFLVCAVGWGICFVLYTGLHCSYPKDRHRQLALLRTELEARGLEAAPSAAEMGCAARGDDTAVGVFATESSSASGSNLEHEAIVDC